MCCHHIIVMTNEKQEAHNFLISSILKFKKVSSRMHISTTIELFDHSSSKCDSFSTSSFYKFTEKFHHCVYSFSLVSADFNHQSFDHLKYIKFAYKCYHFFFISPLFHFISHFLSLTSFLLFIVPVLLFESIFSYDDDGLIR